MTKESYYMKMIKLADGDDWAKYCVPFVAKNILQFPLQLPKDMPMFSYLRKVFAKYRLLCKEVNLKTEVENTANNIGKAIIEGLKKYYDGKMIEAYNIISKELDRSKLKDKLIIEEVEKKVYYRMRSEQGLISEMDFYPLPYNLRYLCRAERFSIPGYPCFYVGYSKNDCILEIAQHGSIGSFRPKEGFKFKLIDLTMDTEGRTIPEETFLSFWPLIAACYVVSTIPEGQSNEKVGFREEYIIPQFLSIYIKNAIDSNSDDFWGIRYYSVKNPDLDPCGRGENDYRNIMFFTDYDGIHAYDKRLMDNFVFEKAINV